VKAISLLGGAARTRTRVRGFAPWSPHGPTLQLLEQVRAVLSEYEHHLPLTIRQIFYRLVGAHNYEKTERASGEIPGVCSLLVLLMRRNFEELVQTMAYGLPSFREEVLIC
jgi:hypothetical protein